MSTLDARKNFAIAIVSAGYSAAATSIQLETGAGALFPDTATDGSFNLVWFNYTDYKNPSDDPNVEIVRCTSRSGDVLTITRAQEGTSATAKNTTDKVYKVMLGVTAKTITDIETVLDSKIATTARGAANGVAALDSNSKVPAAQLPAIAITETYVVLDETEQLALDAQEGDVAIRVDQSKSYIHNGGTAGTMSDWTELKSPTGAVSSVNGQTGVVTLTTTKDRKSVV